MLIHVLNSSNGKEKAEMRKILRKARDEKTESEVTYVRHLMRKYSSIEYARNVAKGFAEKARGILLDECDWMVERRWKQFFLDQTDYLISRKR